MIFCCDFWYRNQYPKFYENTVSMMKGMDGGAFLNGNDLELYVRKLRKRIENDRPKGHSARIIYGGIGNEGKGYLYLVSGKDDTDIARLFIHGVRKIVTYGFENHADFTVHKIAEGGDA